MVTAVTEQNVNCLTKLNFTLQPEEILNVNCNGGLSLLWLLWLFSSFLQLFLVFVVPVAFCTVVVKLFVIVFAAVHHLGMILHKMSLITIFGHKHFRQKFDIFHEKISTASDFGSYLVSNFKF